MVNSLANVATKSIARAAGAKNLPNMDVNVGGVERAASVIGGAVLAGFGLRQRGWLSVALPMAGAALAVRGLTGHCSMYSAMGVSTANDENSAAALEAGAGIRVEQSVTIDRPREELFRTWRQLHRLPEFMSHMREVKMIDHTHSHWVADAPLGMNVEWDAEIINERPNELIAWRSVDDSDIDTAGTVHFTPATGHRGTVVRVNLKYDPPAGKAGIAIAKLFGQDAEEQIRQDLSRFKQLMETGEMATTEGQPAGR